MIDAPTPELVSAGQPAAAPNHDPVLYLLHCGGGGKCGGGSQAVGGTGIPGAGGGPCAQGMCIRGCAQG